jgi:hypothetical protein
MSDLDRHEWQARKVNGKIKLEIKRKPPPPPLEPFVCVVCEREVERDPYYPDHQTPPVCHYCEWRGQGRLQTRQLPFRHWTNFRRAYVLLAALDKEITRARHAH